MSKIRRINLCFDMRRSEDREVYNLLKSKRNKTAYVVDVILKNKKLESSVVTVDKDTLRNIFEEVLNQTHIVFKDTKNKKKITEDIDIPNDVFNIIDNI